MTAMPLIIGMALGSGFVAVAAIWLHCLSIDRRGEREYRAPTQADYFEPWDN